MKKLVVVLGLSLGILMACGGDADTNVEVATYTLNSEVVLEAFQEVNLPTTDARDNSHNCESLKCVSVITTEEVSIYEWATEAEAKHQAEVGSEENSYANGNIFIRANNENIDFNEYKKELDTLLAE